MTPQQQASTTVAVKQELIRQQQPVQPAKPGSNTAGKHVVIIDSDEEDTPFVSGSQPAVAATPPAKLGPIESTQRQARQRYRQHRQQRTQSPQQQNSMKARLVELKQELRNLRAQQSLQEIKSEEVSTEEIELSDEDPNNNVSKPGPEPPPGGMGSPDDATAPPGGGGPPGETMQ